MTGELLQREHLRRLPHFCQIGMTQGMEASVMMEFYTTRLAVQLTSWRVAVGEVRFFRKGTTGYASTVRENYS
jgi:hypothetical protein